jgi:hypothetical protein
MPIRPENRNSYPDNWDELSRSIRFERAGGRCEFLLDEKGNPSTTEGERCTAVHGKPHPITGAKVILTTAHLDHDHTSADPNNLRAGCQRCHNRWDRTHRNKTRNKEKSMEMFV